MKAHGQLCELLLHTYYIYHLLQPRQAFGPRAIIDVRDLFRFITAGVYTLASTDNNNRLGNTEKVNHSTSRSFRQMIQIQI